MSRMLPAAIVVTCGLLLLSTGCRKQKSVLNDTTDRSTTTDADTSFSTVHDFSSVDTTKEAVFNEAQLSDELARRAKEALKPVYFEYNSYSLSSQSIDQLTKIAQFLKENGGMRVLVEGHCDERGSSQYNLGLGENRARVVREYLVNFGVKPIRLETTSYGKEQPANVNCGSDESCHALNRRSEFKALAR